MKFSFWEKRSWLENIDFAIIGSGIVGLSCALSLRKRYPKSKIVIFERGMLPNGASTKNAGFACFGSISEILEDLKNHTEEEVVHLVRKRVEGLRLLRATVGDRHLDYHQYGGYELFTLEDKDLLEECLLQKSYINGLLHPIFNEQVFFKGGNKFNFKNIQSRLIFNPFEGQIDTGKMMLALIKKATESSILILNNWEITKLEDVGNKVLLQFNSEEVIPVKKVFIATNGFAKQFLIEDVKPARAQVLVSSPIKDLSIKGTFHLDKGFYYFRNIEDRILLGGGRNLDFTTEETTEMELTERVQTRLEELLKDVIIPNISFKIDYRWSGIMGVGKQKKPIVKPLSNNVFCGVRLGGMGVAIGSSIGKDLSEFV